MSSASSQRKWLYLTAAVGALSAFSFGNSALADDSAETTTPIKHVIVFIGENWTFDSIYGTYQPKSGQVANLLSKGIVNQDGTPGPNYSLSKQFLINPKFPSTYFIDSNATAGKTPYQLLPNKPDGNPSFPQPNTAYVEPAPGPVTQGQGPFDSTVDLVTLEPSLESSDRHLLTTGASGLPEFTTDTRVRYDGFKPAQLPNGSFQITGPTLPYGSYTGDMVHRLFHMWQQSDCNYAKNHTAANPSGCLNDLYPFVGVARNDGSGSNSMGFLNMQAGDAPLFKKIADQYTINDNYHQPVMGGTAVQHIMLGTADAISWTPFGGHAIPPGHIANPDPISATDVAFKADGQWTNCSDKGQPGIAAIVNYLNTLPWHPKPNCDSGNFS
jgi:phospholipase C